MSPNRGGDRLAEPAPQFEASPGNGEGHEQGVRPAEAQPKTPESSPSRQSAPQLPAIPVNLPDDQTQSVTTAKPSDDDLKEVVGAPASDKDRIEKQWVDKAKQVVATTKKDPFTQKNEMNKVKAEYISKRFNKKIKMDGAVAS